MTFEGLYLLMLVVMGNTGNIKPGFILMRAAICMTGGTIVLLNPFTAAMATSTLLGLNHRLHPTSTGTIEIASSIHIERGKKND